MTFPGGATALWQARITDWMKLDPGNFNAEFLKGRNC